MVRNNAEKSLATPPTSTFLCAQDSFQLPELFLGPSSVPPLKTESLESLLPASQLRTNSFGASRAAKKAKPSRKTTHSQIEKRRREKINDTMERLKNLVPACHEADASSLRKLDVLTATADYIEDMQRALKRHQKSHPLSPASEQDSKSTSPAQRFSKRQTCSYTRDSGYLDDSSEQSHHSEDSVGHHTSVTSRTDRSQDDHVLVDAATSLIKIAESPIIGPVQPVNRMSISELMHL